MLRSLYISNYALIDETDMELGRGLNILTGETGAGKSLLLGAIGLILGRRVDYGFIFNPEKKCVVEAVFQSLPEGIVAELKRMEDFDWDDEFLVVRREAAADGKSRAFINDTPVNLNVLKEVTGMLVDLHGQHQNQMLLDQDFQLKLLDQYAGTSNEAREFGRLLGQMSKLRKQIEDLRQEEASAKQQQDYFAFLAEELTNANLNLEEGETLGEELELMEHAGEIKETLAYVQNSLYDDEASAYSQLSAAIDLLDRAGRINSAIGQHRQSLQEVRIVLEDAVRELGRIGDKIDLDPAVLQAMQERSDFLNRLKKKYNAKDIAELIAIRDDYAAKLGHFSSLGEQIEALEGEIVQLQGQLAKSGLELEGKRKRVAATLNAAVDDLLRQVGLETARFEVAIDRIVDPHGFLTLDGESVQPHATGLNKVDFRIRTNSGMPMGSLGQVASGGEVSRVMLAIKSALAEKAELSVLIFDEIDTGISGEIANKVGRVMAQLANRYQIIAITHLPQIAAKGSHHFKIYKESTQDKTVSRVSSLDEDGRIMELAHMLSGADPSESAIRNAKELITSAKA
ncbi:MAG: DNA repair protein RecN [Bacteroidia bacterium]